VYGSAHGARYPAPSPECGAIAAEIQLLIEHNDQRAFEDQVPAARLPDGRVEPAPEVAIELKQVLALRSAARPRELPLAGTKPAPSGLAAVLVRAFLWLASAQRGRLGDGGREHSASSRTPRPIRSFCGRRVDRRPTGCGARRSELKRASRPRAGEDSYVKCQVVTRDSCDGLRRAGCATVWLRIGAV
jgi:hypothetical protein